ncbi:transmembrane protein, putative [Medicago truncatula]|uniref:Transmembrane protein, putative n=1 Tax=Medicago truncatula TaxID=3880 RepID=A0A072U9J2_MEDTR|nr:transmembrane protein, putative [Medicago truncatula]
MPFQFHIQFAVLFSQHAISVPYDCLNSIYFLCPFWHYIYVFALNSFICLIPNEIMRKSKLHLPISSMFDRPLTASLSYHCLTGPLSRKPVTHQHNFTELSTAFV